LVTIDPLVYKQQRVSWNSAKASILCSLCVAPLPWDQWLRLSDKSIWLVFRRSSVPSWSQFFSVDSLFLVQNVPTGFQQLLASFTWLHKSRQSVLCHLGGGISPSSLLLPFCSSRNREHWRHGPKIVRCHM